MTASDGDVRCHRMPEIGLSFAGFYCDNVSRFGSLPTLCHSNEGLVGQHESYAWFRKQWYSSTSEMKVGLAAGEPFAGSQ